MTIPTAFSLLFLALTFTGPPSHTDPVMTDFRSDFLSSPASPSPGGSGLAEAPPPALFRILSKRPDGACIWARLQPVRTGGEATSVMFCHARDVAYLAETRAGFQMVSLLPKRGAASRLLPVTIGLYVSVGDRLPTGELTVSALPRPSPLYLEPSHAALLEIIARAARRQAPVAFARSDASTITDAAPIDRATALEMLGMQETHAR